MKYFEIYREMNSPDYKIPNKEMSSEKLRMLFKSFLEKEVSRRKCESLPLEEEIE